ncbi:hypothetical protein ASD58_18570 [Duganella sp. Root1480D1]|nr:hypothetical protein ASD58_18570 [Duganella sp. Root1480D1]
MDVLARLRLVDVFALEDQGKGLFRPRIFIGEFLGLFKRFEGIVVVAAVIFVWRTTLRVAPHPILEDRIPHVTAASFGRGGIFADF